MRRIQKKTPVSVASPKGYSYSTLIIQIAMLLYSGVSGLGCRGVRRVLTILQGVLGINAVPHWTTVRQWVLKRGYYQIAHKTFEKAKDWSAILDLTVDVGALKCLLILGVRLAPLKARKDLTLTYDDVEVLGIYLTTKSNGDFVNQSLQDAQKKIGCPFDSLLLDQGSDVVKGAEIYQAHSKNTVVAHDMSHKIANVLEKQLKNDPNWKNFCEHLASTRLAVQQTIDLAALMPPKLRSKARYMSADILMTWVTRFQESKKMGRMQSIAEERFNEYFGWLEPLNPYIETWKQMIAIGETVKRTVLVDGFSHKVHERLEDFLSTQFPNASGQLMDFIDTTMNAVWDEVEQLKPRKIVPGDGRIIESVFGKFKQATSSQLQGITIGALGIATFMADNKMEDVKEAMEGVTIDQVIKWGKTHIIDSLTSLRRKFFPSRKKNKNEGNSRGAASA